MSPPSMKPELVRRPALCRRGSPLGVGMPDFSMVNLLATGVATPSLLLPVSASRSDMDKDCEWPCPLERPLIELRGRAIRPSTLPMDALE